MRCIDEGYSFVDPEQGTISVALPPPDKGFASHLLITGSQAMGLGAVHAGVRLYAGYPMTPSSPLLSFIAELENKKRQEAALPSHEPQRGAAVLNVARCDNLPDHRLASAPALLEREIMPLAEALAAATRGRISRSLIGAVVTWGEKRARAAPSYAASWWPFSTSPPAVEGLPRQKL